MGKVSNQEPFRQGNVFEDISESERAYQLNRYNNHGDIKVIFQHKKLGQICKIVNGSTPSKRKESYWNGDIQWATPTDVSNLDSKYIHKTKDQITKEGYDGCSTHLLPTNSVIYTSRASIGHIAITKVPLCTNQGFKNFICGEDILPDYLYYCLKIKTPEIINRAAGSTFKEISLGSISKITIPVPPLPVQKQIVAILDRAEKLKEKRQKTNEQTNKIIQSVFYEMFGEPRTNDLKWPRHCLKELLIEYKYGTSVKSSANGDPVLRIPNVIGDAIDLNDLKYVNLQDKEREKLLLKKGDILFVRTNGNPSYVGRCAVFNLKGDYVYASYLIRGRFDLSRINPIFLNCMLRTASGKAMLREKARTSAGQYNINTEGLGSIQIILPPLILQNEFAEIVKKIESLKEKQKQSTEDISTLFDALMQKAFKGELVF